MVDLLWGVCICVMLCMYAHIYVCVIVCIYCAYIWIYMYMCISEIHVDMLCEWLHITASIHVFMWLCMNVCLCINVFSHMCICYMPLYVNLCGRYDLYMYLCCTCICVSVCSGMCRLCTVTCVPILEHCILIFLCVWAVITRVQLLLFSLWWLSSCSLRKGLEL